MNRYRVLNVSVVLILSLIFICVFLFEFNRNLVFLNDHNSEYLNSIELRATVNTPYLPIDDMRNMYDSFSLLSRVNMNNKMIYYVYDSGDIDYYDMFLKYNSYNDDDYCFLGYDPFNNDQLTDIVDKLSIKGNEFEIDGLISKGWYNNSLTFYMDYNKWVDLNGAEDLSVIEFITNEKINDKDLSYISSVFSDYEIVAHHCSKVDSSSDKNISLGYLFVFEFFLPALVFLFSLSLFVSLFDSHNSMKRTEHILGRPIVNILFHELLHFVLMALGGVVIGVIVLSVLYHLKFVSSFIDRIEIKESAVNSVIIYFVSVILFGTIAGLKSLNKWRYSK